MLAHFICQLFSFIPFCNGFHFFYHYYYCYFYFTIVYFVLLPQNVFQCDWCSCFGVVLILFCFIPLLGPGAHGQVVCTAGYRGASISGRGWVAESNCRVVLGT